MNGKILAVVNDLMFTAKINDAAKRAGLAVKFVKSAQDALAQAREGPRMIIVDLNWTGAGPLQLIRDLKSDPELGKVRVVGYLSHVDAELKEAAQAAGCDVVLPRSAFSQNVTQILEGGAG